MIWKTTRNLLLITAALLALTACGSPEPEPEEVSGITDSFDPQELSDPPAPVAPTKAPASVTAIAASYEIRYGAEGARFKITNPAPGQWNATGPAKLAVRKDAANNFTLFQDDKPVATGALKVGKMTLLAPDGTLFAQLKLSDDKIKIAFAEGEPKPWEIKIYEEGRAKTKRDDKEYGSAKYYLETEKIKVKDTAEATVAEVRGFPGFSAAPAACLIDGLDRERHILLTLLIFSLGK